MSHLGNKFKILLENYLKIPNVLVAAIMDKDGLVIASSMTHEEEDEELTIAACSGALSRATKRIKQELAGGGGHLGAIVTMEQGQLIFTQAGKNAILTTLLKPGADTDKILPWTYIIAEKIQQLMDFEDPNISLALPKLKNKKDYFFKIAILGNESVGKSSILRRFIEKRFDADYISTIGVGIQQKTYKLSEHVNVILNIWDLSGQMMFKNIRKTYLEGSDSAIIVYDVTRPQTFEDISKWLEELNESVPEQHRFLTMLIGNKIDLDRKVSVEEANNLAKDLKLPYLETSAKTGDNVDKAFGALCYYLIKDSFQ